MVHGVTQCLLALPALQETLTIEEIQEKLTKVINHFGWKGPVGVSLTRVAMRVLGNQATSATLTSMLPKSRGKVATMIHTEAAAYAEMYFGPGLDKSGVVLVCTVGKGFGAGREYNKQLSFFCACETASPKNNINCLLNTCHVSSK